MNTLQIALDLLRIVLQLAPELAEFIGKLIQGSTDPMALRVKDVLPEESESRKAARELGS